MAKTEEIVEPDQFSGTAHPKDRHVLIGHDAAENAFIEGLVSGRLHHAWLIGGPQGVGKATLAYRVARYLIAQGANPPQAAQGLEIGADHPVSRHVSALSHPNLVVLRRMMTPDRKTLPTSISVDVVRRGMSLFETTAADGGYRVCIVDSADDLNANSANALLKLVEEPPPKSVFLIVSHAPQRLLPTIRSRCRRLTLAPLADADVLKVISSLGEPFASASPELLRTAVKHGEGSVRKTLEMLDESRAALIHRIEALLTDLPHVDTKRVLAIADSLAQRGTEAEFALALETFDRWVSRKLHDPRPWPLATLAELVAVCEKTHTAAREIDIYNLDRRPLFLSLFDELAEIVRRAS